MSRDAFEIFNDAVEIEDVTERASFLFKECAGNTTLQREVEELVAAHEEVGHDNGFLGGSQTAKPINEVGRYKLRERIGEGGWGIVYLAEQTEPVRRRVALKIIKPGMDTRQVLARFEAERQALAMMDHPNIARVLDAGATDSGLPYFVMELVPNERITDYCDRNRLTTAQRLELFVSVCQAVQYAHQKGIIHRDIKPSNILVATESGKPVPKVIDFGVAKATTDKPLTDKTVITRLGMFIGTPAYMSPEQADLSEAGIDTRTDIYALGVLLYELLTGQTPFDTKALTQSGVDAMRRTIREQDPLRPSTRLRQLSSDTKGTIAARRQSEERRLIAQVEGDLDWIALKAMEKDRERRYETANALALDVQRFLDNEPVTARPPSQIYRFQKLFQRHRLAFSAAGIALLVLIGAVIVSSHLALRAMRAEKTQSQLHAEAEQRAQQSRESLVRLRVAEGNRLVEQGDPLSALPSFVAALQLEQGDSVREENERMRIAWVLRNSPHLIRATFYDKGLNSLTFSPDGKIAAIVSESEIHVWDTEMGARSGGNLSLPGTIQMVQFSPDGERLVGVSEFGYVRIWKVSNGEAISPLLKLAENIREELNPLRGVRAAHATFSPDGKLLLGAWGSKLAHIWSAENGTNLLTLAHPQLLTSGAFSPEGRRIVTCCRDGLTRVWDITKGKFAAKSFRAGVTAATFSPDGTSLLTTAAGLKKVQLWDWQTGQPLGPEMPHESVITHAFFTPNGDCVVTASRDGLVCVWGTTNSLAVARFHHPAAINDLALSPDGKWLATACKDGHTRVWDIAHERLAFAALPQGAEVLAVAFSSDGKRVAASGIGGMFRVWELTSQEEPVVTFPEPQAVWADFSADGSKVATAGRNFITAARVWDAVTGAPLTPWLEHRDALRFSNFSPDATRILTFGEHNKAFIWDVQSGQQVMAPLEHPQRIFDAAWSPDSRRILTACTDGAAYLWDASTGKLLFRLPHAKEVRAVVFSPDGKLAASASRDTTARIWDVATGKPFSEALLNYSPVRDLRFSPDSKRLVTSNNKEPATPYSNARLWDVATGKLLGTMPNRENMEMIEFSPDGRRIATTCQDRTARVWDGFTGEPITPPLIHADEVFHAVFSPDSHRLATLTTAGDVRLWSAHTGEPITPPMPHPHAHLRGRLCFSPDGKRLLIASGGPGAYLREFVPEKASFAELILQAQVLSGQTIDSSAAILPLDASSLSNAWNRLQAVRPAH